MLSGCSDFTLGIKDEKINSFLANLRKHDNFVIAAICGGPLFLAKAGLLKNKKYTCSLYYNMMELFDFFEMDNFIPAPVVVDQNIITAVGGAFNDFAVNVARKLGYQCNDIIFKGYTNAWKKEDYYAYLSEEDLNDFKNEFIQFIKK
ncbi:MAG: DJ-1/PfpI family protein [Bacilli bacterium]|nr:DJ-1/PfpI family protein [Bacilli bacterium]